MNRNSQGRGGYTDTTRRSPSAAQLEQIKRVEAAIAWLLKVAPELSHRPGQPCPFALDAAMVLRRTAGEGKVSIAQVKRLRAVKLRRIGLDEYVDDPTGTKVPA